METTLDEFYHVQGTHFLNLSVFVKKLLAKLLKYMSIKIHVCGRYSKCCTVRKAFVHIMNSP